MEITLKFIAEDNPDAVINFSTLPGTWTPEKGTISKSSPSVKLTSETDYPQITFTYAGARNSPFKFPISQEMTAISVGVVGADKYFEIVPTPTFKQE